MGYCEIHLVGITFKFVIGLVQIMYNEFSWSNVGEQRIVAFKTSVSCFWVGQQVLGEYCPQRAGRPHPRPQRVSSTV